MTTLAPYVTSVSYFREKVSFCLYFSMKHLMEQEEVEV
jgi:hypothetical protein